MKNTQIMGHLCLLFLIYSASCLTGCIADEPHSDSSDVTAGFESPPCTPPDVSAACVGMQGSFKPCLRNEDGCMMALDVSCQDSRPIYCRPFRDCPPIAQDFSCPNDTEPCDPESDDNCVLEYDGDGVCTPIVYCAPAEYCELPPSCDEGFIGSDQPCTRGETACGDSSRCGQELYCRPDLCEAAPPQCEPWEEVYRFESCADWEDETCRTVSGCGPTVFCRAPELCGAIAQEIFECPEGETFCNPEDGEDEPGECQLRRERSECSPPVYCKPAVCEAMPECGEGVSENGGECAPGEQNCEERRMCGVTIYCRPEQ